MPVVCELLRAVVTATAYIHMTREPKLLFAGVLQTKVRPKSN